MDDDDDDDDDDNDWGVQYVPFATLVPCICRSHSKVLGTQVLVTLFFLNSFVIGIHLNKAE
jgi:hypothetical protein